MFLRVAKIYVYTEGIDSVLHIHLQTLLQLPNQIIPIQRQIFQKFTQYIMFASEMFKVTACFPWLFTSKNRRISAQSHVRNRLRRRGEARRQDKAIPHRNRSREARQISIIGIPVSMFYADCRQSSLSGIVYGN